MPAIRPRGGGFRSSLARGGRLGPKAAAARAAVCMRRFPWLREAPITATNWSDGRSP